MPGPVVERLPLLGCRQKMIQFLIDFPRGRALFLDDRGPVGADGIALKLLAN